METSGEAHAYEPASATIRIPAAALWLVPIGILFALVGAFLTYVMSRFMVAELPPEFATFQSWLGGILFAVGLAFFAAGLVVHAVRSMLQHQTDVLLSTRRSGE